MVVRAHRAIVTGTSVATFYAPGAWSDRIELDESAARHATVKRLDVGDSVRLTNGAGLRAHARIASIGKRALTLEFIASSVEIVEAPARLELWAPVGDRDRMLWLAEKAVELGVSAWRSVVYRRSRSVNPRGEGDAFREKLRARMISALEQSSGAWLPELLPDAGIEDVAECTHAGGRILLDPLGQPFVDFMPTVYAPIALALGPEGGLEPDERAVFVETGWRMAALGPNILRFETAGIAGVTLVRSLLLSA
jgi:16S rRNA (uracil1498-N3)-methyltransferase